MLAKKHLILHGHTIITTNYNIQTKDFKGEIDIISFDGKKIFLNEVKKRSEFAENCITRLQIERIWHVWEFFFKKHEINRHFNIDFLKSDFLVEIQLVLVHNNKCSILLIQ